MQEEARGEEEREERCGGEENVWGQDGRVLEVVARMKVRRLDRVGKICEKIREKARGRW